MTVTDIHDDPSEIRAFSLTRDTWNGDDTFGVLLDTFNDNENAVRFAGLPLGARFDMSISGDGQVEYTASAGPTGMSWNTCSISSLRSSSSWPVCWSSPRLRSFGVAASSAGRNDPAPDSTSTSSG